MGVVVSLIQVLTSIQDTSFGAVPRLAAFLFGLLLLLPWMTAKLVSFTTTCSAISAAMHAEFTLNLSTVYGFLLVLARVSGVIVMVPIPGITAGPDASRIVLALALTVALLPAGSAPRRRAHAVRAARMDRRRGSLRPDDRRGHRTSARRAYRWPRR